jgi:hypothetical protein
MTAKLQALPVFHHVCAMQDDEGWFEGGAGLCSLGICCSLVICAWSYLMIDHLAFHVDRRSLLIRAAVTSASMIIPQIPNAAELVLTPGQTEGPF